jgi:hypothetical protein
MDVPINQKELFSVNAAKDASPTEQQVKALGVALTTNPEDLHIYVNGKDLMETVILKTLLITERKPLSQQSKP